MGVLFHKVGTDAPLPTSPRWGEDSGNLREGKQAEFLLEQSFPWHLVERIGVPSGDTHRQTMDALLARKHRPLVEVRTDWYY